jgi:hypothetical protein
MPRQASIEFANAALSALREHDGVLALGGGAIESTDVREALSGLTVVHLTVSAPEAAKRVGIDGARPMSLGNVRSVWTNQLKRRQPLYESVSVATVDTDGLTPEQVGIGTSPISDGLAFLYTPDLSKLGSAGVWLAAAGQIFFTLSVGMGSLQAYASYLSTKDDIALNGLATAATNETVEVILGGSIAIPAAVTFFGVSGAMAIANGGSYDLGFATMPVVFQQIDKTLPIGSLLGFMWFGLLFFAGITSSVSMLTPIVAFFREEFGIKRETVAWTLGAFCFVFGMMHVHWLQHGLLDEWDYWAGTFGLVLVAIIETVILMWVFKPDQAWKSLHIGADIQIPKFFKFVMTYITPLFLFVLLGWWGTTEAIPILFNERSAGSSTPVPDASWPYVAASRSMLVLFGLAFAVLVRMAWKRNKYDDRQGFVELDTNRAEG